MGFLVSIGTFLGQFLLKTFLSGLFNTVLQKIQDDAQAKIDGAAQYAKSADEASKLETDIVKAQAAIPDAIKATPKAPTDPFRADGWNNGK